MKWRAARKPKSDHAKGRGGRIRAVRMGGSIVNSKAFRERSDVDEKKEKGGEEAEGKKNSGRYKTEEPGRSHWPTGGTKNVKKTAECEKGGSEEGGG